MCPNWTVKLVEFELSMGMLNLSVNRTTLSFENGRILSFETWAEIAFENEHGNAEFDGKECLTNGWVWEGFRLLI